MLPLPRRFVAVVFTLVLLAGCGRAAPADLAPLRSNVTKLAAQFGAVDQYSFSPGNDWAGSTLALLVDTQTIAEELAKQSPAQKDIFLKLADACELFADAIVENNATKMDAGRILFIEAATEFDDLTGESLFEPTSTPTIVPTRTVTPTPRPTLTPRPPTPLPGPPEAMVDAKLMAAPNITAVVSGTVAAGALLDLVMVTADGLWYQTAAGSWIYAANVTNRPTGLPVFALQRPMRTATPTPTPTPTFSPPVATARGAANLRVRPHNDAEIVGRAERGQVLQIVGISSGGLWVVTADGLWLLTQVVRDLPEGLPEIDISTLSHP